ncbi:MAG: hypothetical protein ACREPM_11785 [Gemmatimonadaceae bacterium]
MVIAARGNPSQFYRRDSAFSLSRIRLAYRIANRVTELVDSISLGWNTRAFGRHAGS